MNLQDLNIKKLQYYYVINNNGEKLPFQAIQNNKVINLIHSLVMEVEKPNSYYNRFKDEHELEIYLFNEETYKMDLIKKIKFTNLTRTEAKGV